MSETIMSGPLYEKSYRNEDLVVMGNLITTPDKDGWYIERCQDYISVVWSSESSPLENLQRVLDTIDSEEKFTLDYCDPYDHTGEKATNGATILIGGGWHDDVDVADVLARDQEEVIAWAISTESTRYYSGWFEDLDNESTCVGILHKEDELDFAHLEELVMSTTSSSIMRHFNALIDMSEIKHGN